MEVKIVPDARIQFLVFVFFGFNVPDRVSNIAIGSPVKIVS